MGYATPEDSARDNRKRDDKVGEGRRRRRCRVERGEKADADYYAGQEVHRRAPLFFRLVRHESRDNVSYINVGHVAR